VDHRDPCARGLDHARLGQPLAQLRRVDVAVHGGHGRAERLELEQHLGRREVAAVEDQVRGGHLLPAAIWNTTGATG
jgi:hypothetical protein